MRILMMTNTYKPHVGGVARSVSAFAYEYKRQGHDVLVVAPMHEDAPSNEEGVVRIPALQNFNGSDFSVILPIPGFLENQLKNFTPHIVHAHHPFLIGTTAVRIAQKHHIPLVYTHHTMYEEYTHYVPLESPALKRYVIRLSTNYANMADLVLTPSQSISDLLKSRGVTARIEILPTGVYPARFESGDSAQVRKAHSIPKDAFVVGHVGRLAPEKNLAFLSRAVAVFLKQDSRRHFLLAGYGPSEKTITQEMAKHGVSDQFHHLGKVEGEHLTNTYAAMDLFAFSSRSETQGMVLTEAMAAGLPVVALDASGVREVIQDHYNGLSLNTESKTDFTDALTECATLPAEQFEQWQANAKKTAASFAMDRMASKALKLYDEFIQKSHETYTKKDESLWEKAEEKIEIEWQLVSNMADAVTNALQDKSQTKQA